MKYFAILKDSLREALDSKVLYVTLGLSGILILVLASLSFRPVTMQEEVESLTNMLNLVFRLQANNANLKFEMREFRQVNDAPEPWRGDYHFLFVIVFPDQLTAGMLGPQMETQMQEVLKQHFWWLDHLKTKVEKSKESREVRLDVTSQGTKIPDERSWTHEPTLFFGALPMAWMRSSLTYSVYWVENRLVNTIGGWVAVLLGIVVTAFFIPNMLRKGAIDLLLAKPVIRANLLAFKYLGGLTFMFLNALVTIFGVWLVMGLRSGLWPYSFLMSTLVLTFFFAILYAVSALFGVLTRSTVVCILVTCFTWLVLWIVGILYGIVAPSAAAPPGPPTAKVEVQGGPGEEPKGPARAVDAPSWFTNTVWFIHFILPRADDLGALTTQLLSDEMLSESERRHRGFTAEPRFSWFESSTVSLAFVAVMLGLACWRFSTKDY
jgi:ABC-type transport system involved in multi-copper enzyme maturation permease subunit